MSWLESMGVFEIAVLVLLTVLIYTVSEAGYQ